MAHFDRIEPRPFENFIAIDVADLLDGSRINAGKPPDAPHQMTLGGVRIGAPAVTTPAASKAESSPTAKISIPEAGKGEFSFYPGIRRIFCSRTLHFPLVGLRASLAVSR